MGGRPGFELPFLLAGAFRALIDELHAELGEQGHADARPMHGFALQAIGPDGVTTSELARRLGVSKQAAAKTVQSLVGLGYATREPSADDARALVLRRTPRGDDLLARSALIFERLRRRWSAAIGSDRVDALEEDLEAIVGAGAGTRIGDLPGWLR